MTDFANGVTIGLLLAEAVRDSDLDALDLHGKLADRHDAEHDLLLVAVPPGSAREVRQRIWDALGTTPVFPQPGDGTLAATSPDQDFIRRAYIGP